MKKIELTGEELTQIIKAAFTHYKNKPFGYASLESNDSGYMVQFHDGGGQERERRHEVDERSHMPHYSIPDTALPSSYFPNPISLPIPDFGGGLSGGAGADGTW